MNREIHFAFDSNFFFAVDAAGGFKSLGVARRLLGPRAKFVLLDGVADELLTCKGKAKAFVDEVVSIKPLRESDPYQQVYSVTRDKGYVKSGSGNKAKYHADQDLVFWYVSARRDGEFDPVLVTDDQGMWDAIVDITGEPASQPGRGARLMEPFTFLIQFFSSPLLTAAERKEMVATTRTLLEKFATLKRHRPDELKRFLGELMDALEQLATGTTSDLVEAHERALLDAMDAYVAGRLHDGRPTDMQRLNMVRESRAVLDEIKVLVGNEGPAAASAFIRFNIKYPSLVGNLSEVDRQAVDTFRTRAGRSFAVHQLATALKERRSDDATRLLEQLLVLRGADMPETLQGKYFLALARLHLATGNFDSAKQFLSDIRANQESTVDPRAVSVLSIATDIAAGKRVVENQLVALQNELTRLAAGLLDIGSRLAPVLTEAMLRVAGDLERETVECCATMLRVACQENGISPSKGVQAKVEARVPGWKITDNTAQPFLRDYKDPVPSTGPFPGDPCHFTVIEGRQDGDALLLLCWFDKISSRVVVRFEHGHDMSTLLGCKWIHVDPCTVTVERSHALNKRKFEWFTRPYRLVITISPPETGALSSKERRVPPGFLPEPEPWT